LPLASQQEFRLLDRSVRVEQENER